MAQITYGVGTSHGPLLNLPPAEWEVRAAFDRAQTDLALRDGTYNFEQLHAHRGGPHFAKLATLEERVARHTRCQAWRHAGHGNSARGLVQLDVDERFCISTSMWRLRV